MSDAGLQHVGPVVRQLSERIEKARIQGRIRAARTALYAAEASGDWARIEAAHGRLTGLEIEQWLRGLDG